MNEPHVTAIDWPGISPMRAFLNLPAGLKRVAFLHSDGSQGSRFSLLSANPSQVIEGGPDQEEAFRELLTSRRCELDTELPFVGGLIGSIDYEFGFHALDLEPSASNTLSFGVYDQVLIYDHQQQQWFEVRRGADVLGWEQWSFEREEPAVQELALEPSWDESSYRERFDVLKEAIRQGEIYQACLTFPFHGQGVESPPDLFAERAMAHPTPMSAFLDQDSRQVMSFSPERFLHWDGSRLESKPIKGTRPRGKDVIEDQEICAEILADEKEKAELNMITDLLRNDMAKVSKPGTVKVLAHQELQKLPSVWHTYSQIVSETREGVTPWDLFAALLPGGSISGCPKRRAVKILSELEGYRRGIYTGCVGYISDHGQMDLNIAIRTLEQREGQIQAAFGGGIVFDSEASREYAECFAKAKPFV